MHFLLKIKVSKKISLSEVHLLIKELVSQQQLEEIPAIYQSGDYRLSDDAFFFGECFTYNFSTSENTIMLLKII